MLTYRVLDEFRGLFDGTKYKHRDSSRGDWVALHVFEDLYKLGKSKTIRERVDRRVSVLNTQNKRRGIPARRGDGTFGELVPGVVPVVHAGFAVARGEISTVEIGVEVKILAKAMIKQIGRVESDLRDQVDHFNRRATTPICVGVVGINRAERCVGYEGDRAWPTDGVRRKHPVQEADEAERRLRDALSRKFDELIFLRYRATNERPYPFAWVDYTETHRDYGAALTRVSRVYDQRFGTVQSGA